MVMGVPESGVPAAEGFARASGIPYGQGLVKNRYIGRSFIAPGQQERADAVRRKLNPLHRRPSPASASSWSTTPSCAAPPSARSSACCARPARPRCTCASRRRRGAGPASTGSTRRRTRSCWRPTTPSRRWREILGADSLAYISIENLKAAIGADGGFCDACFTGDYPTAVPTSTPVLFTTPAKPAAYRAALPGV